MIKAIIYLLISIIFEVFATTSLKMSDGFTKLWPSIFVVVGYAIAFYCMSLSTKQLPLSFVYAAWSGFGTILISLVSYYYFKENFDFYKIIGLIFIIFGVILMKLSNILLKNG
ncbi:DMT family transporter [Silvanigrella paludirubra]|uniref:DMT family transporter n=1 Tax=Silvanigrella paludirubra TaxID=2499159 RepID=UPI00192A6BFE|nr:multidrug efflux SMR transporter [Silvanigrella paludirubra]